MNKKFEFFITSFLNEAYPDYDFCDAVADMEWESRKEIRKKLKCPKKWNEITFEELKKYKEMIYFLPPKNSLYYFPLYMKNILLNKESIEYNILDVFLFHLKEMDLNVLDFKQMRAVRKFLNYLIKSEMVDDIEEIREVLRKIDNFYGNEIVSFVLDYAYVNENEPYLFGFDKQKSLEFIKLLRKNSVYILGDYFKKDILIKINDEFLNQIISNLEKLNSQEIFELGVDFGSAILVIMERND